MALRFLIARDMVVEDAVTMFKECLDVRRTMKLDNILDNIRPVHRRIANLIPIMFHGYAKDSKPILLEHTAHNRIAQVVHEFSMEDMFEYHYIIQEFTMRKVLGAASKRANMRIDNRYYIADLLGASMDSMNKTARNYLGKISQDDAIVYPESLAESWVVNAGVIFSVCYAIVKPFLPERTTTKFRIYKSYPQADFDRVFSLETLPTFMGGTYRGEYIIDYTREDSTKIYPALYDGEGSIIWPSQVDPFGEKAALEAANVAAANGTKIKKSKVKVDKYDRDFTEARLCAPWTEEFFYLIENGLAAYESKYEPEKAALRKEKGAFAYAPESLLEEDPDSLTAGMHSEKQSFTRSATKAPPSKATEQQKKEIAADDGSKTISPAKIIEDSSDDDDDEDNFEDAIDVSDPDQFEALKEEALQLHKFAK